MRSLVSICLCLIVLGWPATYGYAAKKGPQATPGEEMPAAGQKPEVAKVKELLKEGKNYEDSGWFHRALRPYQEAMKLSETALGPEHPLTVASMARLASLYSLLGFFDQALPLAQQALQLSEKALGPEHPRTAQSLRVLGSIYGQMGAHDQALSLSQRALQISEKALGPEDPQTAAALSNLATLYTQVGSYDQAMPAGPARRRDQRKGGGTGKPLDRGEYQKPGISLFGQERLPPGGIYFPPGPR